MIIRNRVMPKVAAAAGPVLLAALAAVYWSTHAMTSATAMQWAPQLGSPPWQLSGMDQLLEPLDFRERGFLGRVTFGTEERRINIAWTQIGSGAHYSQEVALAFWPTACTSLADGKSLCIAGKERLGNTRIQKLTFDAPLVFTSTTGLSVLVPAPIAAEEALYNEATQGRDLVRFMTQQRGVSDRLLLQFYDSGDIYSLDIGSAPQDPPYQLIAKASGATTPPVMLVPQLANPYSQLWTGDHQVHGFLYVLCFPSSELVDPLVLMDGNRDGTLDGSILASGGLWVSMGFSNGLSYQ
ncbi:MAG: hypothetical protein IPK67_03845 [Planctomycetes bacterium]|nr:hypothetical protein [Planctomycetota bacterium]